MRLPDSVYEPPALHSEVAAKSIPEALLSDISSMQFGEEMRDELFTLDPAFTFLNHGAFGAALRPLQLEAEVWRRQLEAQPLRFIDRQLLPLVAHSVRSVAALLGCPPVELLPLPNVTTGLNAILASLEPYLAPGDTIACTSLTYGSTKKMLAALAARTGCALLILPISLPLGDADGNSAVADILAGLGSAPRPRLLVLDSVTSNTAIKLPVGRIARAVRAHRDDSNLMIIADAAHSLQADAHIKLPGTAGASEGCGLDGVDGWLTNGHKWACMPKGAAFLWAGPRLREVLRPAVVSHGLDVPVPAPATFASAGPGPGPGPGAAAPLEAGAGARDKLLSAFAWDGCRDYAALLTAPSAIAIWARLPGARDYSSRLLLSAAAMLVDVWRSSAPHSLFPLDAPHACFSGSMLLVPLPDAVNGRSTVHSCADKEAFALQNALFARGVEVPVKAVEGRLYLRLSCHVHNSMDQFQRLARVVQEMG